MGELQPSDQLYNYISDTTLTSSHPDWPKTGVITRIDSFGATIDVTQSTTVEGDRGPQQTLYLENSWHNVLTLGYLGLNMEQAADVLGISPEQATWAKAQAVECLCPFSPTPQRRRFPPILHAARVIGIFAVRTPNTNFDFQKNESDVYDRRRLLTAAALLTAAGRRMTAFRRYTKTGVQKIVDEYRRVSWHLGIPYDNAGNGIIRFGHATGILPSTRYAKELERLLPDSIDIAESPG